MKALLRKIRQILRDRKTRRIFTRLVSTVAAIVVFVTTYALVLPAITMESEAACGIEAHQHDQSCYTDVLVCELPESPGHVHDESCYSKKQKMVCQQDEHTHDSDCYDENGELICEKTEHQHGEDCFEEVRELVCEIPESPGHQHNDSCYQKVLTCGKEVHTHSTACYRADTASQAATEAIAVASTESAAAAATGNGLVDNLNDSVENGEPETSLDSSIENNVIEGNLDASPDNSEPVSDSPSLTNEGDNDEPGAWTSTEATADATAATAASTGASAGAAGSTGSTTGGTAATAAPAGATDTMSTAAGYVPVLDELNFDTLLNKHTGIYYSRLAGTDSAVDNEIDGTDATADTGGTQEEAAAVNTGETQAKESDLGTNSGEKQEEAVVENTGELQEVATWNRIDKHTELKESDNLRLYLAYTIPAGSLNETNQTARYSLPKNIHLTDEQVNEINATVNGIAGQYVSYDTLEILDQEMYGKYLGIEAVEGTRTPADDLDEYLANNEGQEFISATVKVENVFDENTGLLKAQDLVFTFAPYTIQKNQHQYDSEGQPIKAGEEVNGWLAIDISTEQIDWEKADDDTKTADIIFVEKDKKSDLKEISTELRLVEAEVDSDTDTNVRNAAKGVSSDVSATDNKQDGTKDSETAAGESDKAEKEPVSYPSVSFDDSITVAGGALPTDTDEASGDAGMAAETEITVHVEADKDTFPEGTTMVLSAVSDDQMAAVAEAVEGAVDAPKTMGFHAVDISFRDVKGNEIEPLKPIRVSMTSDAIRRAVEDESTAPVVVHVSGPSADQNAADENTDDGGLTDAADADEAEGADSQPILYSSESTDEQVSGSDLETTPEANIIEIDTGTKENNGDTLTFDADAFSVYAIVYTVDFHYEINGKMYEFSIPGGGFVSLEHLVEVLGIASAGENTANGAENVENGAENGDDFVGKVPGVDENGENGTVYEEAIKLNEVEVSEATKKFVANVEKVKFSNPELVWVGKVDEAATVGRLKEANGLEVEYSADLTEEQIAEINAQTVEAGDWALISVQPFTSEETLTITMKNGDVFTIKVTDAQISWNRQLEDGKKYVIYADYYHDYVHEYAVLKYNGDWEAYSQNDLNTLGDDYLWTYQASDGYIHWANKYGQHLDVYSNGVEHAVSDFWCAFDMVNDWSGGFYFKDLTTSRYLSWDSYYGFRRTFDYGTPMHIYEQELEPWYDLHSVTQNNIEYGHVKYVNEYYTSETTAEDPLIEAEADWGRHVMTWTSSTRQKPLFGTLTAVPEENYRFVKWTYKGDGKLISWGSNGEGDTSLTIAPVTEGSLAFTAEFAQDGYPYMVEADPEYKGSLEAYVSLDSSHTRGTEISLVSGHIQQNGDAYNNHHIIARPQQGYTFDHWELYDADGNCVSQNLSSNAELNVNQVRIYESGMKLVAKFEGNGPSHGDEGRKLTEAEKKKLDEWLLQLNEDIPLGDTANKTAQVYDYENRVYKITMEGKSTLKSLDGTIGMGFVMDVSASMKFPAKLENAFTDNTGNGIAFPIKYLTDSHASYDRQTNSTVVTIDGNKYYFNRSTPYYVISDAANTATVWRIFWDNSSQKWRCVDASKLNSDNSAIDASSSTVYKPGTETPNSSLIIYKAGDLVTQAEYNKYSGICSDLGLNVGMPKNRAYYLQVALQETLSTMNDIVTKIQLATDDDSDKNPDIQIAWTTFAKQVGGGKNGDGNYNTTFSSVAGNDIGLSKDSYSYSGGTSTDWAFFSKVANPTSSTTPVTGSAYTFNWSEVDHRYLILITDGAPQRDSVAVLNQTVINNAYRVIEDKDVEELITLGLSMESVVNGRALLGDLADLTYDSSDPEDERLFFEAKYGEDLQYVLYQIVKTLMQDAIIQCDVQDTIDAAFYPVDETGLPLADGSKVNLDGSRYTQADEAADKPCGTLTKNNDGTWVINWTTQDFPASGWSGSVFVKAKEDFLGGNSIETNVGKARITPKTFRALPDGDPAELKDQTPNLMDTPLVNVDELRVTPNDSEWTVYLGTQVNPRDALKRLLASDVIDMVVTNTDVNSETLIVPDGKTVGDIMVYGGLTLSDGSNTRAKTAGAQPAQMSVAQVLGLSTEGEIENLLGELIANGTATRPYSYISNGQNIHQTGEITLTLEKNNNGNYNEHPASPVGEAVETYSLRFEYKPSEESINTTPQFEKPSDWSNGTGSPGVTAGNIDGTNTHMINVYANSLEIIKMNHDYTQPLPGARFALYRTWREKDGENTKETPEGLTGNWFKVAENETNDLGIAQFNLVEKVSENEELLLVEAVAPNGYVKGGPWRVTLSTQNKYKAVPDGEDWIENKPDSAPYDWEERTALTLAVGGNRRVDNAGQPADAASLIPTADASLVRYQIMNNPGVALPNTGGPGTRLFTIIGTLLILGAGVLLWRRRRLI